MKLSAGKIVWWNNPGESTLTQEQINALPGLPELSLRAAIGKAVTAFTRKNLVNAPNVPAYMRKVKGYKFIESIHEIKYAVVFPVIKDEQLELPVIFDVIYSKEDKAYNIVGTLALPQAELAPIIAEFREQVDKYMRTFSSTEMSLGLRGSLLKVRAIPVRPAGAVFFITNDKMDDLREVESILKGSGATLTVIDIEMGTPNFDTVNEQITREIKEELDSLNQQLREDVARPDGMSNMRYKAALTRVKELHAKLQGLSDFNTKAKASLDELNILFSATSKVLDRHKPADLDKLINDLAPHEIVDVAKAEVPTLQDIKVKRASDKKYLPAPTLPCVTEEKSTESVIPFAPVAIAPTVDPEVIAAKRKQLELMDVEPDFSWALTMG